MLEYVILGMLALRPLSGYDLGKWMDGPGRFLVYRAALPQIYRTLGKMTDNGLLEFEVDPREGKPSAKVYRLTEEGRRALLQWAHSPYEPSPRLTDPDFLVRLLFTGPFGLDITLRLLRTELNFRRYNYENPTPVAELTDRFEPIPAIDSALAARLIIGAHERGRASARAYIEWLETTLRTFEGESADS